MAEDDPDRRPVPDPTELTTQALRREIEGLREFLESRLSGHVKLSEEKFERIESLRREQKEDTEKAVQSALAALKELINELKSGFDTEITALQRRVDENRDRIVDTDRKANGVVQQKAGAKEDRSGLYAGLGAVAIVLAIIATIIGFAT